MRKLRLIAAGHDGLSPGARKQALTFGYGSGRYWVRTSDLLGVNEALYH